MPSPSSSALPSPPPRRTHHRRRSSALRLSADTMTTLPEYVPAARYHHPHLGSIHDQDPLDQPPDYPDSAEEADEDTDTDTTANNNINNSFFYVPHTPTSPVRPHTASPRRQKRFLPTHKRRPSFQPNPPTSDPEPPPDPYLDSLLARSVHALEMSNTLLQSSISTQSSLSTLLAADSPGDAALEARARGLSSRIQNTWDGKASWANDLEAITRDVEGLFDEEVSERNRTTPVAIRPRQAHLREASAGVSASLPVDSGMAAFSTQRRPLRRPSLDLRESPVSADSPSSNWPSEDTPRLVFSQQHRASLISPPPRAITQYVASTQGADAILLPSTLGLRSPPSLHPAPTSDGRSLYNLASSSTTSLLSTTSSLPPQLTDRAPEPTTPAYNMLASFVARPPSSGSITPSTSFTQSFMRRRGSASTTASNSTERPTPTRRRTSPSPTPSFSSASSAQRRSRSQTPRAPDVRPMTPTVEESSPSSSSSDSCLARRTVQSLRKILDEQPPPPPKSLVAQGLRPPAFMPRTPAPAPHAGTSTATASVSRLFTKGTHSSSTRAPSPPRQSAMKRSASSTPAVSVRASPAGTPPIPSTPIASTSASTPSGSYMSKRPPSLTSSTLSIPEFVGRVLKGSPNSSAPSSRPSTPNTSKRISFAALPESYAASRPPDPKFKDKAAARKRRRKARSGSGSANADDSNDADEAQGWSAWLGGGLGLGGMGFGLGGGSAGSGLGGMGAARHEEKMEDRMTRNWGRMSGGGGFSANGLDEWAV